MTEQKRDLYKILKLKKTATQEQITAAYRKLALRWHPDRNSGSQAAAAKFDEITKAYDIISDPAKRVRYDETGECDDRPANDFGDAVVILRMFYADTLRAIASRAGNAVYENVQGLMRQAISNKCDELNNALRKPRQQREEVKALMGRWETTEQTPNFLEQCTRDMMAGLEAHIASVEMDLDRHGRAFEVLKNFSFRFDKMDYSEEGRRKAAQNGFGPPTRVFGVFRSSPWISGP